MAHILNLLRSSGNSIRTFVCVFHTVSYVSDGDRWRHFGTATPASHMVSQSSKNSEGSSKESRSLLVSAGRRMVGCHPMANGHGSNEPETTRTEPKGTGANRKTCKPTRGNDGGRLAGAVENRRNSNETHPVKRNSRMTDAPGGEPGGVVSASSRGREGFAEFPALPKTMKPAVWRC